MRSRWNELGESWVRNRATFERILEPFGRAVVAALAPRPGMAVLDVGCGFGATLAALVAAGADATGVDISAPMTAEAARRVPAATLLTADAEVDHLGGPYDGVLSRFGVMFFADPQRAFANLAAATSPGGRLAFVCWRDPSENPCFTIGMDVLLRALPEPPPTPGPEAPGPFAFADADRVRAVLDRSGWHHVDIRPFDAPVDFSTDTSDGVEEAVAILVDSTAGQMLRRQLDAVAAGGVLSDVRAALAGARVEGRLRPPGAAWVVTATRGAELH